VVTTPAVVALAVRAEGSEELPEEASEGLLEEEQADLWAKVVDISEVARSESVEVGVHVVLTMRAAPAAVEPDAALVTTRREFCLTSVLVEITSRRPRTHTLAAVQGISTWSR